MSVSATVIDGQITNQKTPETADSKAKTGGTSSLDKDSFLQLLVTQMQYQDPLEPQDNSQMVSQLATFSSLEEMQNMSHSLDKSRASSLIGQYVDISHTDASGKTTAVEGVVDFVTFQGSSSYVSVNGELYDIAEVQSVVDGEYTVAVKLAENFNMMLNNLPDLNRLTDASADKVSELIALYSGMDNYQKSMISSDALDLYNQYAGWLATRVENA
ncbi:MAG: flagellar hook capping protein [Lachnospiraceae bacterium]|nr:flagellar hook capping protein [Lachnospiraceae bacterium]